jgi:hypothetical protein
MDALDRLSGLGRFGAASGDPLGQSVYFRFIVHFYNLITQIPGKAGTCATRICCGCAQTCRVNPAARQWAILAMIW